MYRILLFVCALLMAKAPLFAQEACSGVPVTGSIIAADSVCSGVPTTLKVAGASSDVTGLSYQWQSSTNNTDWENIADGTSDTVVVAPLVPTWYRRTISCGLNSDTTAPRLVSLKRLADCYCIPGPAVCSSGPMLRNVRLNNLNNTSFCSPNGFGDYSTSLAPVTVYVGLANSIAVTVSHSGPEAVTGWIDYNHNSVFEASEYFRIGAGDAITLNAIINVPVDAVPGLTKMRLRVRANTYFSAGDGCTTLNKGETEDYAVNLVQPATCNGMPSGGTTLASMAAACPSDSIWLSVNGGTVNLAGLTYQWQKSPDLVSWQDIPGNTTLTAWVTQSTPTYYRRTITCGTEVAFSNPVYVNAKTGLQCYCKPAISNCSQNDRIARVTIGSFTKASDCAPGGYIDYTDSVAPIEVNPGPLDVSVTVGPGGSEHVAAWIDFNRNAIFEPSEYFYIGVGNGATLTSQIQIPVSAVGGATRMRIRVQWNTRLNAADACKSIAYGETEDFPISISVPYHCVPQGNSDCSNETITRVRFGTFDTTTACSANGYGDYTGNPVITVQAGSFVPLLVEAGCAAGSAAHVGVWIDFNHNNVFDRNEFTMIRNECGVWLADSISIPTNALLGTTVMRIRASGSYWFDASDACTAIATGETEDYSIGVTAAACPVNTWTGLAGTNNWEDAGNWSCQEVPGIHSNVLIENGTVVIRSNVTVYSINAGTAATLTVLPQATLVVTH